MIEELCQCIDATHIFDGLNDFPTHIAHMRFGTLVTGPVPWPITNEHLLKDSFPISTTLYDIALQWLKDDKDFRRELENQGRKLRGARRNEV
jgi:CCR4-NOT complex subunit CAF16